MERSSIVQSANEKINNTISGLALLPFFAFKRDILNVCWIEHGYGLHRLTPVFNIPTKKSYEKLNIFKISFLNMQMFCKFSICNLSTIYNIFSINLSFYTTFTFYSHLELEWNWSILLYLAGDPHTLNRFILSYFQ